MEANLEEVAAFKPPNDELKDSFTNKALAQTIMFTAIIDLRDWCQSDVLFSFFFVLFWFVFLSLH